MLMFLPLQGDDDVYLCVNDGGGVTISAAHVSGRQHPELATEVHTHTLTDHHQHTRTASQCGPLCLQEDLRGRAWRLADGVIQCRFQRNILLPQLENRFNLNQSYFLFLAHGRSLQGKTAVTLRVCMMVRLIFEFVAKAGTSFF